MWFEFIDELRKKLEKETNTNVYIGIDQPKDVRNYPFISLIPAEFTEDEEHRIMVLAIAFGIREEEANKEDPAPMYERGVNSILNLMRQIEEVISGIKVEHFQVLPERETVKNFDVKAPKFLMEMHIAVALKKFQKPMEDF